MQVLFELEQLAILYLCGINGWSLKSWTIAHEVFTFAVHSDQRCIHLPTLWWPLLWAINWSAIPYDKYNSACTLCSFVDRCPLLSMFTTVMLTHFLTQLVYIFALTNWASVDRCKSVEESRRRLHIHSDWNQRVVAARHGREDVARDCNAMITQTYCPRLRCVDIVDHTNLRSTYS